MHPSSSETWKRNDAFEPMFRRRTKKPAAEPLGVGESPYISYRSS